MVIAFYINEMNFRGVANSTYFYAYYNEKILKNKSVIFYNRKNLNNLKPVLNKFKKKFKVVGIVEFSEINLFKKKFKIEYIYTQKGGERDSWVSQDIKTLVHSIYPQKLKEVHGHNYAFISQWISKKFSNEKIPFVPYIVETKKNNNNLKKKLNLKKNYIVFGCHGGDSSFDLKFVQKAILNLVKKKRDLIFLFLNINKFCDHPRIKFLKGTSDENYKKSFLNTCDAMIYGRSQGESFGLSCAEFAINNKIIISYKFNRHRSHEYHLSKNQFKEYGSYSEIYNLISNFKPNKKKFIQNKYKSFTASKSMKIFENVFLKNNNDINFTVKEYFLNFMAYINMNYLYLRHKIYNHYFNYFESKVLNIKD